MKHQLILKTLLVFALRAIGNPSAQTAYDFRDDISKDATVVALDFAKWCDANGHRFFFERTPLAEIVRTLGGGHLDRTGDAGAANFDYFVNYTDGIHLVTFSSNNDMGGADKDLQGVSIRKISASDHVNRLPRIKLPIRFSFGASDVAFSRLTQELGHATEHNNVYAYTYSTKYTAHDTSGRSWTVDVYEYLQVRVRGYSIISLSVDRSSEGE